MGGGSGSGKGSGRGEITPRWQVFTYEGVMIALAIASSIMAYNVRIPF
jgi:hypothetical protein